MPDRESLRCPRRRRVARRCCSPPHGPAPAGGSPYDAQARSLHRNALAGRPGGCSQIPPSTTPSLESVYFHGEETACRRQATRGTICYRTRLLAQSSVRLCRADGAVMTMRCDYIQRGGCLCQHFFSFSGRMLTTPVRNPSRSCVCGGIGFTVTPHRDEILNCGNSSGGRRHTGSM